LTLKAISALSSLEVDLRIEEAARVIDNVWEPLRRDDKDDDRSVTSLNQRVLGNYLGPTTRNLSATAVLLLASAIAPTLLSRRVNLIGSYFCA
jgi:hypothetical protein